MIPKQRSQRVIWLACASLVLGSGCATTRDNPDAERRLKQANSNFEIGLDHLDHGRYALGLRALLEAEKLDPKNAKFQVAIAEAYMHRGRPDEAEAHLLRAIEIYPGFQDARLNLSALYLMLGRNDEAAAQAQILVDDATFPATWRALTNLGMAEMGSGRFDVARETLGLAIEYNKTYWPALLARGILEQRAGRVRESIDYFNQTLAQNASPSARAEVNYRLAEIYVTLGKHETAISYLKTAVAQSPEGEWGKKSEEYLKILR
jgi:tetratricopeptide (TPR) repeat protein